MKPWEEEIDMKQFIPLASLVLKKGVWWTTEYSFTPKAQTPSVLFIGPEHVKKSHQ